jgi:cytochrome c
MSNSMIPETRQVKLLARFDVCTEGNYEDGMLGIVVDPKFYHNRRIFIYYSPPDRTGCSAFPAFTCRKTA